MKAKKTYLLIIALLLTPFAVQAQTDSSYMKDFDKYKEEMYKNYNDFLEQTYSDFEAFLSQAWIEYQSIAGSSGGYSGHKPELIPSITVGSGIIDIQAPAYENAIPFVENEKEQRNESINRYIRPSGSSIGINFYGRNMTFDIDPFLRVCSEGLSEKKVAKHYATMRQNDTEYSVQHQLDDAVDLMGLNEWGYFVLLRSIAEKLYDDINDRVLFAFYMMHSHGFKARVGRGARSKQLLLLLALDNSKEVYSQTFFRINGCKYYVVYGNGTRGESIYSYDEKADDNGLKEIGLDFAKPLCITACDCSRRLHINKVNTDIEIPYSTSHLRYYDDIPTTVFPIYFKTPVTKEAESVLASTFASLGKMYNKVQMVDIMLNFVQTAFAYKIDEQQYGREKYFFPEEVIGLPYSDCEDRSALFAWLVSHFVGYDVIGVLYDDHLATAVCFGDDAQFTGKSVSFHGKRYIICDPTYSNAPIGTVMPKYANTKYEIVEINQPNHRPQ